MVIKPHTGDHWSSVVSSFEGHGANVLAMSPSSGPNGTVVASASADGTIKVWDATTGECFHTFTVPCKGKFPFNIFNDPELESILLSFPEGSPTNSFQPQAQQFPSGISSRADAKEC